MSAGLDFESSILEYLQNEQLAKTSYARTTSTEVNREDRSKQHGARIPLASGIFLGIAAGVGFAVHGKIIDSGQVFSWPRDLF
jgi:hypothetical protein